MASQCRHNYHEESESAVNKQINLEFYASYVYLAMACNFDRDDVAVPGFCKFVKKASDEQRQHGMKLMEFQNRRGGRIVLNDVTKPERGEWGSVLEAVESALELEKRVNQALLDVFKVAEKHGDAQMCDFIQHNFLSEQMESIKQFADYRAQLRSVGPGLGQFQFDKMTFNRR